MRAVNVVSEGPIPHGLAELLSVEDVGSVWVHLDLPFRVALRKRQPRSPNCFNQSNEKTEIKYLYYKTIEQFKDLVDIHV